MKNLPIAPQDGAVDPYVAELPRQRPSERALALMLTTLADAFGRRNIILGALAVFAVASLGCAR